MREFPRITVRPYVREDLEATIEIFVQAIRKTAIADYSDAQLAAWAQVDRKHWEERRLGRCTWLALLDDSPAGFTELEPNGHLDMMFVHPSCGRSGVATALLETVEEAAYRGGVALLFTEASITARRFFERQGFRTLAEQQVNCRGEILTNFRMEKSIQRADS